MQHGAEAGRNVILQVCTHWCLPMKQRQLWTMTRSLDQNKLIMAVRGIYLGILWMHDQVIFSPSTSVTWKSSHVLLCLVEPEAGRPNVEQIKKSAAGEWLAADWAWIKVKDHLHLRVNSLSVWGHRHGCDWLPAVGEEKQLLSWKVMMTLRFSSFFFDLPAVGCYD